MTKLSELELQLTGAISHHKYLISQMRSFEHLANLQTQYIKTLEAQLEAMKGINKND